MAIPSLSDLKITLEEKETDKTWMDIDSALQQITNLYRDEPSQISQLNRFLVKVQTPVENSIITDRTRLSGTAVALIQQMAESLEKDFLPFLDWVLPAVLKLPTRTNKVTVTRANSCIKVITQKTKLSELLPYYIEAFQSPSKALRLSMVNQFTVILEEYPQDEITPSIAGIESCLRDSAIDSAPEVREASRIFYNTYSRAFPDRLESFDASLSDVAKKYLQNKSKPTIKSRAKPTSNFKKFLALKKETTHISSNDNCENKTEDLKESTLNQGDSVSLSEPGNVFSGPTSGSAQLDSRMNRRQFSPQSKVFSAEIKPGYPAEPNSSVSPQLSPMSSRLNNTLDVPQVPASRKMPLSPINDETHLLPQSNSRLEFASRPTFSNSTKISSPKVARTCPSALSPSKSHRINRTFSSPRSKGAHD